MLVWINGPFGGGKTQTAHDMRRRLPGSVISDPEHIGFGLHRAMPAAARGDFQHLAAWRLGVVETLERTLAGSTGTVIVPMTVTDPDYFEETVGRLRADGHRVVHVALLAERATVVRRLRQRGLGRIVRYAGGDRTALRRESFALARLDDCLARLVEPRFAEQIWTDRLPIPRVAERVAEAAGLTLAPDTDGRLRGGARRAWVGVRHVRF